MDKAVHPGIARKSREPSGAGMVHQLKALCATFPQDADAVDQPIVVGNEGRQQRLVADCDVQRLNLPDVAEGLEKLGRLGIAAADGDDVTARGETFDDISTDEPRPAEDRGPVISHGSPRLGAGWRAESQPSITHRLLVPKEPTDDGSTPSQQRISHPGPDEGLGAGWAR